LLSLLAGGVPCGPSEIILVIISIEVLKYQHFIIKKYYLFNSLSANVGYTPHEG